MAARESRQPGVNLRTTTIGITQEIVRRSFATGAAVIVGRGSAYLLGGEPSVLKVMLRADRGLRIRALAHHENLGLRAATRRVEELDSNWGAYARQVHHVDWGDPGLYDLVIDTGRLGHRGAAEVILTALAHARAL